MDISTSQTQTTVVTTRSIERVDAGHGLHAVRWTDTTVTTVARNGVEQATTQSVAHERVLTGAQQEEVEAGLMPSPQTHHFLLTPAALDALRNHTYYAFLHVLQKGTIDNDEEPFAGALTHHQLVGYQHAHRVAQHPFTSLVEGAAKGSVLVQNRLDSHSVLRAEDGGELARLQVGEYTSGQFDNAHYDLTKAATHLLTRPDIRLYVDRRYGVGNVQLASTPAQAIHQIPGYNSERGRDQHLLFRWMPSQEDWDKVCGQRAKAPKTPKTLFSSDIWQAVFELDILGLRACGAAHFTDYFESKPTGGDDDD
jgi:hypothetical protein